MIPKSEVKEGQMRKERGSKSSGILGASWAIGSSFSPDPAVKFGQYVVMLKLSWAMLNRVEAICQIMFGHVVGFASEGALPQQNQDFK